MMVRASDEVVTSISVTPLTYMFLLESSLRYLEGGLLRGGELMMYHTGVLVNSSDVNDDRLFNAELRLLLNDA